MRTRSKYIPTVNVALGPLTWQVYNSAGTLTENQTNGVIGRSLTTLEGSEIITDDPSPGRGVKSVTHTKILTTRPVTNSSSYRETATGRRIYRQGQGCMWYDWAWGATSPIARSFPGTHSHMNPAYSNDEAKLIADTVHAFYAANETDNLLNIIEAPQLVASLVSLRRTLKSPDTVRAMVNALKAHLGNSKGLLNRIDYLNQRLKSAKSSASWSKYAKELKFLKRAVGKHGTKVSGAFLAYSFGIAPLVSDMKKVHSALDSIHKQLKSASSSAGKLVSIHRQDQGTLEFRNLSTGVVVSSPLVDGVLKWRYAGSTATRTCTVRGYRTQKFSTPAFQQLDYLLTRFGSAGPATLAKELIPFSFVLEWFVDLRNLTDRLDNLLTGNSKRIIDVCLSEKLQYAVEGHFDFTTASYNEIAGIGMTLVRTDVSHYNRKPITSYNIVRASGRFGKKQAALSAALLHQYVASLFR